jgi:endosialidase-like protein
MAWLETGGANTNPLTVNNWLGTINAAPLIIRTEGAEVMRVTPIDSAALPGLTRPHSVGIGTTEPRAKLHVNSFDSVRYPSIHAGGSTAALSFASRSFRDPLSGEEGGFLPDAADGARWEWRALSDAGETSSARLWSGGGDKLFVTGYYGQVLLNPGVPLPDGRELLVGFPEVPIGTLTFRSAAVGGRVPPDPPVPGELVLGGVRTSIRGFDGDIDDPSSGPGRSLRYGHHWIRTNGNHFEHWMAFRREPPGLTWPFPQRTLEAAVSWYGPSFNVTSCDERLKTNVRQLEGALDKLERIRGVAFESAETESPNALGGVPGQPSIGVVAQEVEEVFPEVVSKYEPDQECRAVDYNGLIGVLIEAVKELKSENEALRSRIEALERT